MKFRINNNSWIEQKAKKVTNLIDSSGCGDICSTGLLYYLKDNKSFIKSYYNANKLDISENVDDKTFEKINNFIETGILINE